VSFLTWGRKKKWQPQDRKEKTKDKKHKIWRLSEFSPSWNFEHSVCICHTSVKGENTHCGKENCGRVPLWSRTQGAYRIVAMCAFTFSITLKGQTCKNLKLVSRRALATFKCQIGWEGESLRKLNHQVWGASMRGVVSKFGYVITESEAFDHLNLKFFFCSLMSSLKVKRWTPQSKSSIMF